MSDSTRDLVTRLDRLEKENRTLKRWGAGVVGLAAAATLMSAASPLCKTVWAERFVLKDSSGRERGRLTAYETGGVPQLTFYDERGRSMATLGLDDEGGTYLAIYDEAGKKAGRVDFSADGVRHASYGGAEGGCDGEKAKSKAKPVDTITMR